MAITDQTKGDPGTSTTQTPPSGGLLHSCYYLLKPFLPLRIRYSLRRIRASYKLRSHRDWPILESANKKPKGWAGWPNGKSFAFVLTHDVEGPRGVERVPPLAALEARLGFRSSFNFIPEGTYRVSPELREHLAKEGFEVGVHDWHVRGLLDNSLHVVARKLARPPKAAFSHRRLPTVCYLPIGFNCFLMDNLLSGVGLTPTGIRQTLARRTPAAPARDT